MVTIKGFFGGGTKMQSYLQFLAATAEATSREGDANSDDDVSIDETPSAFTNSDENDSNEKKDTLSRTESLTSSMQEELNSVMTRTDVPLEDMPSKLRRLLNLDDDDTEQHVIFYTSWLVTDILLQGKMYLTPDTLLFITPMKVDSSGVIRTSALSREKGFLPRKGFVRNWFVLRQSTLTWYNRPDDIYFPQGFIYLSSLKTAELRKGSKRNAGFNLVLKDGKRIKLRADNSHHAVGWVRDLKREIFRCGTVGAYAVVRIPLENVKEANPSTYLDCFASIKIKAYTDKGNQSVSEYQLAFNEDSNLPGKSDHHTRQKIETIQQHIRDSRSTVRTREIYDTTPKSQLQLQQPDESSKAPQDDSDDDTDPDTDASQSEQNFFTPFKTPIAGLTTVARLPLVTLGMATKLPAQLAQGLTKTSKNEDHNDPDKIDFRTLFGLSEDIQLIRTVKCYIVRKTVPHWGTMYITNVYLCFLHESTIGDESIMIMPLADIQSIKPLDSSLLNRVGFTISATAIQDNISFEFSASNEMKATWNCLGETAQDWCSEEQNNKLRFNQVPTEEEFLEQLMSNSRKIFALQDKYSDIDSSKVPPIIFDPSLAEVSNLSTIKPIKQMRITMLTIGSRGDVQPYIALAQGLQSEGHKCRIVTHTEFGDWVKEHNIEFKPVAGDPGDLMKIMIKHGGFTMSFIKDAVPKFRVWIRELLETAWLAVKDDTDILIESPSAMAGIHIAEALNIPYFRAFTMPWTRTRRYPHAFIVPERHMGGSYNYYSYAIFDVLLWMGISKQVNHWRRSTLKLESTSLEGMRQQEVPFMYCVSPTVLVPPVDQPDWITYTGYWFMNEDVESYKPDPDLSNFIKKARDDAKKLVYVGFGSIVVDDPELMTQTVVDAVKQAGVRCILARGWSRRDNKGDTGPEITSESIFEVSQIPHDWLFPRVDAVAHHGGSGTTGASLRAGIPTIIKPFFGDQFFYANRVVEMGVGINVKDLNTRSLCDALVKATTDDQMISRALSAGRNIRSEFWVKSAIVTIYRELGYAKSVTEKRAKVNRTHSYSSRLTEIGRFGLQKQKDFGTIATDLVKSIGTEGLTVNFFKSS